MALQVDPDLASAHNTLGAGLARNGQLPDATDHLRRAVELTPECFECRFNLGRVLAAQSRFAEALLHFRKAVELRGGTDTQSLWFLALMYSETDQPAEAVSAAQRALLIAEHAGDTRMQQTLRQAIAQWQRASGAQGSAPSY